MSDERSKLASYAACAGALMLLVETVGCSGRPSLPTNNVDPTALAETIVQQLDRDGDGLLTESECTPLGLQSAFGRYDASKNAQLSVEEIAQGVSKWSNRMGLASVELAVFVDGQPCADVNITLKPDAFLEDYVSAAKGVTRATGVAKMQATDIKLPEALARQMLMFPGLYEVTFEAVGIQGAPVVQGVEIEGPATGSRRIEFRITRGEVTQDSQPD